MFKYPVRRTLPQSWKQATKKHAQAFGAALMLHKKGFDKIDDPDFQFIFLRLLLRIRPAEFYRMSDYQVTYLLVTIKELFEGAAHPALKKLPKHLLANTNVENFCLAYERYYERVLKEGKPEDMAILYHYLTSGQKLNDDKILKEAKRKPLKNMALKMYVYWWYYHNRQELQEIFPGAFGKAGSSTGKAIDFTSQHGWTGLIHSIGQDGPFGTEMQVIKTPVHHFLSYLDFNHDKNKETEMRMKINK